MPYRFQVLQIRKILYAFKRLDLQVKCIERQPSNLLGLVHSELAVLVKVKLVQKIGLECRIGNRNGSHFASPSLFRRRLHLCLPAQQICLVIILFVIFQVLYSQRKRTI